LGNKPRPIIITVTLFYYALIPIHHLISVLVNHVGLYAEDNNVSTSVQDKKRRTPPHANCDKDKMDGEHVTQGTETNETASWN